MSKFIRFLLCLILMLSIFMTFFAAQVATASEEQTDVSRTAFKRGEVENRARAMANMEWTVEAWHKTVDQNEYVTIHDYILEAEVGTKLRGIPYCWGGFNGLETTADGILFADAITMEGQRAGNIRTRGPNNSTIGLQPKTVGLDCSGFVSAAYGFDEHINARALCETDESKLRYGNPIGYDELKPMDYIGKPGVHVVLYLSEEIKNGVVMYTIIDSSVATGKVAIREVEKSYYVNEEYQCFTPWNPQCTYQTTYTSAKHTKECSDCGHTTTSAHTFVYSSNNRTTHRKYCSGCSYLTNQSHTMILNSNGQLYCSYCGFTDGTAINSNNDAEIE